MMATTFVVKLLSLLSSREWVSHLNWTMYIGKYIGIHSITLYLEISLLIQVRLGPIVESEDDSKMVNSYCNSARK